MKTLQLKIEQFNLIFSRNEAIIQKEIEQLKLDIEKETIIQGSRLLEKITQR
ncbi:unnamed protein product [Paramecium pentaurelia]|uniref:Uncharacterized protein n=1 Tax=Paramecium pentaurelia TaxID=43138 RepID=A0A8S1XK47_9CILI|nr:unnamed protein product [Paramecium pentaurelia]